MAFTRELKMHVLSWMRRHWIISTSLAFIAAWSSISWFAFTPIRNPWPKEAYTIKGRFPFDKGYELIFFQSVYGEAEWHQRWCGGIQIEKATCSAGLVYLKPNQIDGQHYEITLYRDYYLRGLPQWTLVKPGHGAVAFKAGIDFDYKRGGGSYYRQGPPDICDDSKESLGERHGRLFCMAQYYGPDRKSGYLKYIQLQLPDSAIAGPNEEIKDFWLTSELDRMLVGISQNPDK